ncbi:acetyl-CoA carboxylase biotin carboxylase subunit family protein [Kitasatospora sp. NPDC057512]|uniref:ATP-grasp domain-containing protein n=1 Tax=Kitasatospora sp. NPDC057512 TaxID=3346154 RepID=UPI0036B58DE7
MHVVLIALQADMIRSLAAGGHSITLLYEPRHKRQALELSPLITRRCAVDSYERVESLWSGLECLDLTEPVEVVLAGHERAVVSAAVLGSQLGATAVDPLVAMGCRDKATQKSRWSQAGVPTARWCVMTNGAESVQQVRESLSAAGLEPPVVIKPPLGGGSLFVSVANSYAEICDSAGATDELSRPLVEQKIDGPEWHLDGLVQKGRITDLMVSKYLTAPIRTGTGAPVRSVALPPAMHEETYAAAMDFSQRAVDALELARGVFHLEAFGQPGRFIAGELACRPGGTLISRVGESILGLDLWAASAQLFTGDPIVRKEVDPGLVHGWVHLPSVAGSRNSVTEADILGIDGVTSVSLKVPVGAVMGGMLTSSSNGIGAATVSGSSEEECRIAMDRVVDRVQDFHEKRPYDSVGD